MPPRLRYFCRADSVRPAVCEEEGTMNPMAEFDAAIDGAIARLSSLWGRKFFEKSETVFEVIADYAAMAAALLVLAIMIVAAVKTQSAAGVLHGAIMLIGIAICRYAGRKFLGDCKNVAEHSPPGVVPNAFPKVLALTTAILLLSITVSGLFSAIDLSSTYVEWTFLRVVNTIMLVLALGVPNLLCLVYLTNIFLNPDLISTKVAEAPPPGQVALGLFAISFKSAARLAPIIYGGMTALGAAALACSLINALGEYGAPEFDGSTSVIGGLIYPLAVYVLSTILSLLLDLWRAILSLLKS
jgi:hypothetical protein